MIIVRSPLRISLGGGGTDLPAWYEQHGAALVTAAIDKYIYFTGADRWFDRNIWLSYSRVEICSRVDEVQNELLRCCLAKYRLPNGVEMHSLSEVPGSSGLGSSGAFLVGALTLLNAMEQRAMAVCDVAELACSIEMKELRRSSGKQDQYASACGGIQFLEIDRNGHVTATALAPDAQFTRALNANLLLYYTGVRRDAEDILREQAGQMGAKARTATEAMHEIQAIGLQSKDCILSGDLDTFGRLLHRHWDVKKSISGKMSVPAIDAIYDFAILQGALGGKLMGAGGGGFFMFYVPLAKQDIFRRAMVDRGLAEMSWRFDPFGCRVVFAS
jgi:D-glycero-alpha-D-manno-heptose-7-phosphate kinase